ncbi:MAG: UvrB/UvrC motif-containing protein [Clostridia bacterium]|jgi:protein arginine kinase activator|nr:UvrB/UvrC motif-containing protein [Clostridia bacterium]
MLCDKCNIKEATVNLTQINEQNKKVKLHLCNKCANDVNKIRYSDELSFNAFLKQIVTSKIENTIELKCDCCGMELEELRELEKFGCPCCYDVFNKYLDDLFMKIHGKSIHVGNVPEIAKDEVKVERKLQNLKGKLQEYIELEEYEKAARLRDEIKLLEQGSVSDGN